MRSCSSGIWLLALSLLATTQLCAAITPAQRKEIGDIKKQLGKVNVLIDQQDTDGARQIVDEAAVKLKKIAKEAGVPEDDKTLAAAFRLLETKRELLSAKADSAPVTDSQPAAPDKPTDEAAVSFVRDIAPFMVNLCLGCHGATKPKGGLSLVTFDGLMKGGDSGPVVLPENWEESRLWQLVGKQDPIKMPQGNARITPKNWEDLKNWLKAGAKFDGSNRRAPLGSLIPSADALRKAELSKMSAEDLAKARIEKSRAQWKRANPRDTATELETKEFFILGNVDEPRLKEVGDWGEKHADLLRETFDIKTEPIWKGKLAIFVFKDRFGYEEFPRMIEMREPTPGATGHSHGGPGYEEAYVCVQDVGDAIDSASPGLAVNLLDHLAAAYLKTSAKPLPDWLVRGTGLALAARTEKKNAYLQNLRVVAAHAVQGIEKPADVFANGSYLATDVGPVGSTLVTHLIHSGGLPKFSKFVKRLQGGSDLNAAIRLVYSSDVNSLGISYLNSLGSANSKKALRKKK